MKSTFKTNRGIKTKRFGKMAVMMAVILIALCTSCKKDLVIEPDPIEISFPTEIEVIPVEASPSPREGGVVEGNNVVYQLNDTCTLTAVANSGYEFVNWTTLDGTEVSTDATYSFIVKEKVHYYANFILESSEVR